MEETSDKSLDNETRILFLLKMMGPKTINQLIDMGIDPWEAHMAIHNLFQGGKLRARHPPPSFISLYEAIDD